MPRYKITFAYKGTAYCGWQVQPNGISIQSLVEAALSQILQEPIKVKASGRTDAGVHAIAQVAHFDTASSLIPKKILQGLRSILPDDLFINTCTAVADDFDAQLSAVKKTYVYIVNHSELRFPFINDYYWQIFSELNYEAMTSCLQMLTGEHDFTSFTASDAVTKTFNRILFEASCTQLDFKGVLKILGIDFQYDLVKANSAQFLLFKFTGNGFLKHMVRNLVGTIINVGQDKLTVDAFEKLLTVHRDRREAGIAAPAKGLFLLNVNYDEP